MIAADDPRHGTRNAYNNLGCRCERCRQANTDYLWSRGYNLVWKRRKRRQLREAAAEKDSLT